MSLEIFVKSAEVKAQDFFKKEEELDYKSIINLKGRPLSPSSLKYFMEHPAEFIQQRQEKWKGNAATVFGNLCDVIIYTPKELEEKFVIAPTDMPPRPQDRSVNAKYMKEPKSKEDFAKKAACESALQKWDEFDKKNAGKKGIIEKDLVTAFIIKGRFERSKLAMNLLNGTEQVQRKLRWTDKDSKLPCVGILDQDGTYKNIPFIVDLKIMDSASPRDFTRRSFDLGYDLPLGMYINGYIKKFHKFPDFYYIVMEKKAPFAMNIFKASAELITYAKEKAELLLGKFAHCYEHNLWHQSYDFHHDLVGYDHLNLPAWLKAKEGV